MGELCDIKVSQCVIYYPINSLPLPVKDYVQIADVNQSQLTPNRCNVKS
jgi:hypothetical protein